MTLRSLWFGTVAVLLAGLLACEPAADRPVDDSAAENGDALGPAVLMPVDHSGVTGTIVADRNEDAIVVTIAAEGLQPEATYLALLFSDRCAADGPERLPLGRVRGEQDGTGSAELRARADEIPAEGAWSVQIHTEAGETVACADIANP